MRLALSSLGESDVEKAFGKFDIDDNKALTPEEMYTALAVLDLPRAPADVLALFDAADQDGNMAIDRKEFSDFLKGFAKEGELEAEEAAMPLLPEREKSKVRSPLSSPHRLP